MKVRGQHLGDQRVKLERIRPQQYVAPKPPRRRRQLSPAVALIVAFLALIALGTVVLTLPISNAAGEWTSPITALFTATSAVCVPGLVVVDTGTHWSSLGHLVIVLLIQAGGFGIMTSSSLLLLMVIRRRTRLRDRVLVQESVGRGGLGDVTGFVKRVAAFTLLAEGLALLPLTWSFINAGFEAGPALWYGAFHSVSAFNNAGFDLMGAVGQASLRGFVGDFGLLGVIGVLIVLGGLGYAIVEDVIRNRSWQRLALETKVVVLTSILLIAVGTIAIGLAEWDNPATLGILPTEQRVLNALFESVTLRTAGFSALDTGALLESSIFIVMALMFIGGASGSTAGGIKVNTFSVLLIAIVSTARGLPSAVAFGRRIQHVVVYRAISVALLSIAFLFGTGYLLELLSPHDFLDVLFEAVSALGTVGASRGITGELSDVAQLVIIVAMFVGRLGPLTLVIALAARQRRVSYRPAVESMRIG
ncbi:Trk family potassium uptake protein [soil metagenome]